MANVRINVDHTIVDGETLIFKAPCSCNQVTGLIVYYPIVIDGATSTTSKVFSFRDTNGKDLSNIEGLFAEGAYVNTTLDTNNNYAYIYLQPTCIFGINEDGIAYIKTLD